jgi:predicted nicotinamide N-methyase
VCTSTSNLPSADLLARYAPLTPVEPGSPLLVHLAPDVFALWEAWEHETGAVQPVPYWAVPWPAAVVLSRVVLARPEIVRGRRVVDLGCGGAAGGLAAARAGAARVTANDVDPVALHVARLNAAANGLLLVPDLRDLTQTGATLDADVILVGDLFYERGPAARLERQLRAWAAHGLTVLVADAGRPFAPRTGVEAVATATVAANADLEGVATRCVRVGRLLPG